MFWVVFGLYTAFVAILWVVFLVARMHTYKFRNYSFHIEPVTRLLAVVLTVLTVVGYYFVLTVEDSTPEFGGTLREATSGRTF